MFEILMRRHNPRLYCAALAIVQDEADAEESVQHAYLAAYRNLDQFECRARFSTWLTRIAVHEALARRRRRLTNEQSPHHQPIDAIASGAPDPERQAYAGELGTLLDSALGGLPGAVQGFIRPARDRWTEHVRYGRMALVEREHGQDPIAPREELAAALLAARRAWT
jgi:RNA polymerase sigma-70 factor (ECF subfamily)